MDLIITILPVVTKDLPISPRLTPYNFLSRCKFSTLTTRQPMVEFYLLTFPRFPLRKKVQQQLDHSGDLMVYYTVHTTVCSSCVPLNSNTNTLPSRTLNRGRRASPRGHFVYSSCVPLDRNTKHLLAACPLHTIVGVGKRGEY